MIEDRGIRHSFNNIRQLTLFAELCQERFPLVMAACCLEDAVDLVEAAFLYITHIGIAIDEGTARETVEQTLDRLTAFSNECIDGGDFETVIAAGNLYSSVGKLREAMANIRHELAEMDREEMEAAS